MAKNVTPWTDEDVRAFAQHIKRQGGSVRLPVRQLWDGGIEAEVQAPADAPADWGQQQLTEFDKKRT